MSSFLHFRIRTNYSALKLIVFAASA